jgi:Ca-activated chloride channel family protein
MTPDEIRLIHPELAPLVLLAILVVVLHAAAFRASRRALARFAGRGAALVSVSAGRQLVRAALVALAVASLALAAAGPFADLREVQVRWRGVDLVVALDVSQSMATRDAPPDRLHAAREAIRSLVDDLPGSRVALLLFGGNGIVRYPTTTDPKVLLEALDNPGRTFRPTAGSSLRAAVDAAVDAFPADGVLPKAVVVVSDGEDLSGERADLSRYTKAGIRLFAVTVGTAGGGQVPTYDGSGRELGSLLDARGVPVTSRMHEEPLRSYATATGGGEWHYDGTPDSVRDLQSALLTMASGDLSGQTERRPDDRYQIPALVALAALLLEWVMSDRRAMPLPKRDRAARPRRAAAGALLAVLLLATCSDPAATNESANGLFAARDFDGALTRYRAILREHPDQAEVSINAGNTLYQLGQFERALANYEAALNAPDRHLRAVALYDRGNALFRLGRTEEARAAYVEALRLDPDDRDAKFNIEVIDRLTGTEQGRQQAPASGRPPAPARSPRGGPSPNPSGGPEPGGEGQDPKGGGEPGQGAPGQGEEESLSDALGAFRQGLTPDEALRLLDALQRDQRGVVTFLEASPGRQGQEPRY